jgi:hypothetical protein
MPVEVPLWFMASDSVQQLSRHVLLHTQATDFTQQANVPRSFSADYCCNFSDQFGLPSSDLLHVGTENGAVLWLLQTDTVSVRNIPFLICSHDCLPFPIFDFTKWQRLP